tara:strand:- start:312 stop:485 length:174 start_codon:yes stop_codon:yes gene_type:complete
VAAVVDALVADVPVAADSVACWAVVVAGLEPAEGTMAKAEGVMVVAAEAASVAMEGG